MNAMDSSLPALNVVRTQTAAIRTTIAHHVERELHYNPDPNW